MAITKAKLEEVVEFAFRSGAISKVAEKVKKNAQAKAVDALTEAGVVLRTGDAPKQFPSGQVKGRDVVSKEVDLARIAAAVKAGDVSIETVLAACNTFDEEALEKAFDKEVVKETRDPDKFTFAFYVANNAIEKLPQTLVTEVYKIGGVVYAKPRAKSKSRAA